MLTLSSSITKDINHSVVLVALVDHNYRLTYVDIGGYGSNSDSNVFRSAFGNKMLTNKLNFPGPKPLPNIPTEE